MSDDRILEFMAQVGDYMKSTDRQLSQLIEVMHNGFGRVHTQLDSLNGRVDHLTARVDHLTERVNHLTARVDHLTARVDHLTEEVAEIKHELREVKAQVATINRRLNATFDQTGRLTEQADSNALRVAEVEQALEPTNAELHQRLLVLEQRLEKAA